MATAAIPASPIAVRTPNGIVLADIMKAYNLLLQVNVDQVRIHKNVFTTRKLYTGVEGLDPTTKTPGFPFARKVSNNEILRKNIYFLGRQAKEIITVVIQMTQRGYLSLDEKDIIMDHENDLMSGVEFFRIIIKQDPEVFSQLQEVLRMFSNSHIADLLISSNEHAEFSTPIRRRLPPFRPFSAPVADTKHKKLSAPWFCVFCTFENPAGTGNICQVCFKTQGSPFSPLKDEIGGVKSEPYTPGNFRACPYCTLENPLGTPNCNACGNGIDDDVGAPLRINPLESALTGDSDDGSEWSDN